MSTHYHRRCMNNCWASHRGRLRNLLQPTPWPSKTAMTTCSPLCHVFIYFSFSSIITPSTFLTTILKIHPSTAQCIVLKMCQFMFHHYSPFLHLPVFCVYWLLFARNLHKHASTGIALSWPNFQLQSTLVDSKKTQNNLSQLELMQ